jgi:hypothetical protein
VKVLNKVIALSAFDDKVADLLMRESGSKKPLDDDLVTTLANLLLDLKLHEHVGEHHSLRLRG